MQAGYNVIVVDNLSNSKVESLNRVKKITGRSLTFYECDLRDRKALTEIFTKHTISAVMHFAGLKAVGESCLQPLTYYQNNVYGSLILTEVMAEADVKCLIFSSSATYFNTSSILSLASRYSPTLFSNRLSTSIRLVSGL